MGIYTDAESVQTSQFQGNALTSCFSEKVILLFLNPSSVDIPPKKGVKKGHTVNSRLVGPFVKSDNPTKIKKTESRGTRFPGQAQFLPSKYNSIRAGTIPSEQVQFHHSDKHTSLRQGHFPPARALPSDKNAFLPAGAKPPQEKFT